MAYKRPEVTGEMNKRGDQLALEVIANGVTAGKKTDTKKALHHAAKWYKTVLNAPAPQKVLIVASPEEAIKAAITATGCDRRSAIRQLIFLNLWTWYPTRAWAALHIRGIDPKAENIHDEVVAFTNEKFQMSKDLHAILCLSKTCIVVEYPVVFAAEYDLKKFRLHRDGGLAIEYGDGTGFGYLNHIEVPDWLTCTPAAELDTLEVMALTNVDARREGLARIERATPGRVAKDIGATVLVAEIKPQIGRWWDYELLDADFKDDKKRVLLKMFDVGSQKYCTERVDEKDDLTGKEIKTISDARAWRKDEDFDILPFVRT
jgi:hypothetical protein